VERLDPWRSPFAIGVLDLGGACVRAVGVAGFSVVDVVSGEDEGGTLVLACAKSPSEPQGLLAFTVQPGGAIEAEPRWTHPLAATPTALVATPLRRTGDGTLAIRYSPTGELAAQVDLFTALSGWIGMVTAPGPVVAAVPSPDGNVVAVAVAGDPAIWVLGPSGQPHRRRRQAEPTPGEPDVSAADRPGIAPRRIELPAPVGTLAWQAALDVPGAGVETPRLCPACPGSTSLAPGTPVGGTFGGTDADPPPPVTETGDAGSAATGAGSGWLLVTWQDQPGGAIVTLAPWSTAPIVFELQPGQPLVALVDDGGAVVGASAELGRAWAFPWTTTGVGVPSDTDGGGP
jgi:hypothetical protein